MNREAMPAKCHRARRYGFALFPLAVVVPDRLDVVEARRTQEFQK